MIVFAVSGQGTAHGLWNKFAENPVLTPTEMDAFDAAGAASPSVIRIAGTHYVYYTARGADGVSRIAAARSSDLVLWEKLGIALETGPAQRFDTFGVSAPEVVQALSGYFMYYMGFDGIRWRIGLAASTDGIAWTRVPGPAAGGAVLEQGPPGAFDAVRLGEPAVLADETGFRMWYSGNDGSIIDRIGYAESTDGVTWIRVAGPGPGGCVLDRGPHGYADGGVLSPAVRLMGGHYRMVFTARHY